MRRPRSPALPHRLRVLAVVALLAGCAGCGRGGGEGESGTAPGGGTRGGDERSGAAAAELLEREIARVDSAAGRIDAIFRPLPLLRPAQESALRSFPNAAQLARARQLGIERNLPAEAVTAHERAGDLVRLADSEYWVIGELDHSQPLLVPGVVELLREIGGRFQERLNDLGAPAFRFEISSILRTAADQEALRAVNPNAALGESTHEYGTTVDVLYSAFAAPTDPIVPPGPVDAAWAEPFIRRYAEIAAERVAARRAMELKALLGEVLLELQREGRVMVTLERQQPVFHMTLAGLP